MRPEASFLRLFVCLHSRVAAPHRAPLCLCGPFSCPGIDRHHGSRQTYQTWQNIQVHAVLISTYEMGRQPFGLASPCAWLRRAGWEVTCVDAAKQPLHEEVLAAADLIAFHLPMHTATRLAAPLIENARRLNPSARICAYGLY